MDFTFGILSYNSSDFIIELLESIKYQVLHYGNNKKIELIIGDDSSKDNTVELIKKWIKFNGSIFYSINILESPTNRGTVINYSRVFHSVHSEKFHIIAGDDLYNCNNIFDYANFLDTYDIVTTFPLGISNKGEIFIDSNRLIRRYRDSKHKNYTCKELVSKESYGSMIHSPSTFFKKALFSKEVEDFVAKFVLYEDDPMWVSFLHKTNKLKFDVCPYVLYRYNDNSVSHSFLTNAVFKDDIIKLCEFYLTCDDISWFNKIYIIIKLHDFRADRKYGLANFIRLVERCFLKLKYGKSKQYRLLFNKLLEEKEKALIYYEIIKSNSSNVLKLMEDKNASN